MKKLALLLAAVFAVCFAAPAFAQATFGNFPTSPTGPQYSPEYQANVKNGVHRAAVAGAQTAKKVQTENQNQNTQAGNKAKTGQQNQNAQQEDTQNLSPAAICTSDAVGEKLGKACEKYGKQICEKTVEICKDAKEACTNAWEWLKEKCK